MASDHIVKSFDQELDGLKRGIATMGGLAESQIESAIQCITRRDGALAGRVVENDRRLDTMETEIANTVVRMLAQRQPMARDLRDIVASLKIASDLERIGDYAANLAKRAIALAQVQPVRPVAAIPRMGRLAQEIVKEVLDAYAERDLDRALTAWRRDEELDDLYNSLFRETLTYMMEDPRNITPCTHLLFIAKNIERIGDHATNVAETIHFLVAGGPIGEARPKGDLSSFAVVTPDQADPGQDVPA